MSVKWAGLGLVVVLAAVGLGAAAVLWPGSAPTGGGGQIAAGSLDDLMMDLQLLPLDGQRAKPFTLESLDGRRVALADLAGKPVLLYFWATW